MTTLSPPTSPGRDVYYDHHNQAQMHSETRPRAETALSYVSNRSRRSSGSNGAKLDLTESSKDKKRLHTKADPSVAMSESQPAAVALEESNLESLRLTQHKDMEGNIIMDPDRSNPTRPRMERPLDTIRSFQAAAEGTSSNRRSTYSESQFGPNNGDQSRRSSYYGAPGGYNHPHSRQRPGAGGYYRNQSHAFRPDSFVEESPGSSQQWPHRMGGGRNMSAPINYPIAANGEGPSPTHSHQQSNETMTSGSEENGKSTNPSSHNSSFDQLHMLRKPGAEEAGYGGQNGYNGNFSSVSPARGPGPYGGHPAQNGNHGYPQQQGGPAPPPKPFPTNNPRVPIKLGGSSITQEQFEADFQRSDSTKRKSWFSRKFSKGTN